MKISKHLFQAMAASLVLGPTFTGCDKNKNSVCKPDCRIEHPHTLNKLPPSNTRTGCPGCGLG